MTEVFLRQKEKIMNHFKNVNVFHEETTKKNEEDMKLLEKETEKKIKEEYILASRIKYNNFVRNSQVVAHCKNCIYYNDGLCYLICREVDGRYVYSKVKSEHYEIMGCCRWDNEYKIKISYCNDWFPNRIVAKYMDEHYISIEMLLKNTHEQDENYMEE